MEWFVSLCVILILNVTTILRTASGATTSDATSIELTDSLRAWICNADNDTWANGDKILIANSSEPSWDTPGSCSSKGDALSVSPCPSDFPELERGFVQVIINGPNSSSPFGLFYQCDGYHSLLSGRPGYLLRCIGGAWEEVNDACDDCNDDCELPRDCSELALMNMTNVLGNIFRVTPSGRPTKIIFVRCVLHEQENHPDGGRTEILRHFADSSQKLDMTLDEYINGSSDDIAADLDPTVNSYFIGLRHLADLTWTVDGEERPQVMEILMTDTNDREIFAVYDHVVINKDSFVLESLGNYHGNAGDFLSDSIGSDFCGPNRTAADTSPCWWAAPHPEYTCGTDLTADSPSWGDQMLKAVHIYIRLQEYDEELTCPLLNTHHDDILNMTRLRTVGAVIKYKCTGDLMYEGEEGGDRTLEGEITCVAGTAGSRPAWDRELVLPCTLVCPDDYVKSRNNKTCYYFSDDKVNYDIAEAAKRCAEKKSVLAYIYDVEDLNEAINGTYYYTGFTLRRNGSMFPYMEEDFEDIGFTCHNKNGFCKFTGYDYCISMTKYGGYFVSRCKWSYNYVCMRPSVCPPSYILYNSTCYKVAEVNSDFTVALDACNVDGSALAYPETVGTLEFLAELVKETINWTDLATPQHLAIGLSDLWEDMNVEGLYYPDVNVVNRATTPLPEADKPFRYLTVNSDLSFSFSAASFEDIATHAICQHKAPIGCWEAQPDYANMTRTDVYDVDIVGQTLTFSCKPGYFVNGTARNKTPQLVNCSGLLGGWVPGESGIYPCIGVDVCPETPPAEQSRMTMVKDDTYRWHTFEVTYKCDHTNIGTIEGESKQTVTCTDTGDAFEFDPSSILDCDRCKHDPVVRNADISGYSTAELYQVNESFTATCESSHYFAANVTSRQITCTDSGWDTQDCKKACDDPPAVNDAITDWDSSGFYFVGDFITATCTGILYFAALGSQVRNVSCTNNGWANSPHCEKVCIVPPDIGNATTNFADQSLWETGDRITVTCNTGFLFVDEELGSLQVECLENGWESKPNCEKVCLEEPLVENANMIWDSTAVWKVGSSVPATCLPGYLFMDNEDPEKTVQCTENGWQLINPGCEKVCVGSLLSIGNTVANWDTGPLKVGEYITATCLDGFFISSNIVEQNVSCTDGGWGNFADCESVTTSSVPVCAEKPAVQNAVMEWDSTTYYEGDSINVSCAPAHHFAENVYSQLILCTASGWEAKPDCTEIAGTTPGPTTTEASIILSTLAPYPVDYPVTTNYYWATLQNNMSDCHGRKSNFKQTNGPFGFGYATEIDETHDQCQIHKDFSVSGDLCAKNPAECTDGFSISLWEKTTIDFDDYKALNDSTLTKKKKYFISTGGDADGHPGVAVYQEGWWLHALVSTGEKVWKVKAAGALRTDKWNNIALRWENTDNSHGLQLLVNLELKAQIQVPETKTALEPLDPPEMMIGCHKTKAMDDYGFYNTFVADELAIWTRFIDDDENRKFLGGYQENFEDVAVADFQKMLQNVNMADEDQLAAAVDVLDKMTASEPDPADENSGGNPSPTSASASSTTKDKATASSPTASSPATTAPPMDKDFPTLLEIIQKLMDTKNVPLVISEETAKKRLRVLAPMSNVIGNPNKHNWDAIHSDKYEKGSVELILGVNKLTSKLFRSLNYTNTSIEFTMDYPNLVMQVKKTTIADLKEEGCRETPDYKTIPERAKSWNYPIDRCRVCGDLFSDPICDNRPVTVVTTVYSSLHNTMPMRYNTEELSIWSIYELDACIQNVDLVSDVERDEFGDIDPRMPNCTIDPKLLAKRPFVCKAEHKSQPFIRTTMKQLKFHENEFKSTIKRRLCVWWNTKLHEGLGGWDTQGCVSLHTQDGFTKCACKRVGLMSILAENTEAKVVPDEQLWLTVVKYIGYILSFLCLIAFIAIVAIFGDLKDMFHLMGLNLAVAQFLGSVVMLISDMEVVRDDRHACTAIGTIIQYFFFASGSWAAFLGHASFKAITAGIVGGKLRAYGFIAWGLPLVSVGLTYLLFLHDLGDDPRCFISWDNNPKYAFFGPQLFFCALCISFGVIVLLNLSTPALRKDNLIEDYGSFCRGAAFVLLFFGLTWIFGFLAYMRFGFREPSFYPIFQVLNSWIGLMIFLFIGVGSKKFRMIVAGQAKLRRKLLLGYAFGTPHVPVEDTEQLGSPADQRKDKPRPSSAEENLQRPLSTQSNFLAPPASGRGMVAGRPGSTSPRPSSSGW